MKKFHITLFLSLVLMVLLGTVSTMPAWAAPQLQAKAIVGQDIITLGDIFSGLENGQDIWVADAPLPGKSVTLPVKYIAALTRRHGIGWRNNLGLRYISVERDGYVVPQKTLRSLVKEHLRLEGTPGNFDVTLHNRNAELYLAPGYSEDDVSLTRLEQRNNGFFTASFSGPAGGEKSQEIILTGQITEVINVPVLKRMMTPGDTISKGDITWMSIPKTSVTSSLVRSSTELLGQSPRRALYANTALRNSDVEPPVLIHKGSNVNMVITAPGLLLSAVGRALENGGMGDIIRLLNTTSHQTVKAEVTGEGEVRVLSNKPSLMAYAP